MSIFAELATGIVAATDDDTKAVAKRLAAELRPDTTVALSGDLGAGKTTFVKGLAAAWNVREAVTSPSFAVCNFHRGDRLLAHVDAYRLSDGGQWESLMIEEFLDSPWCLAVEWPEHVREFLSPDTLWLSMNIEPSGARLIRSVQPS
jgi:tRNA threonylcarbamoyladenosine biosynthesis protein TsaE